MNFQELINEMTTFNSVKADKIKTYQFTTNNLTIIRIRDMLFKIGHILIENLDKKLYIASIKSGFLKMNTAIVGFCLLKNDLHVAVFAEEGLIKQNTCEEVINEIKKELKGYIIQI